MEATEKQLNYMKSLGIDTFPGITKDAAKAMISAALEADDKPEVVKPYGAKPKTDGKFTSMYVSYAKDIFCKLTEYEKAEGTTEERDYFMEQAIALVKQAREAFE